MSENSSDMKKAAENILVSIDLEDYALNNILGLEGDIIQKAKKESRNINDFVAVNESVNKVVKNLTKMQMLMQYKHENAGDIIQKLENNHPSNGMEE